MLHNFAHSLHYIQDKTPIKMESLPLLWDQLLVLVWACHKLNYTYQCSYMTSCKHCS